MVKILALSTFVITAVMSCGSAFAADSAEPSKAEQLLKALDIISAKTGGDVYTRSGFVEAVLRETGNNVASGTEESVFSDVEEKTSMLNAAYDLGIISGYGGEFRPADAVTAEEAAAIVVRALGYSGLKNNIGDEYTIANSIDLFKGTGVKSPEEALDYEKTVRLLYNMLDCEIMYVDSRGNYSSDKDGTVMHDFLNVWDEKGIVQADVNTNITSLSLSPGTDEVVINGDVYRTGSTKASEYIGMYVDFYYRYDEASRESTLVLITPRDYKVQTIDSLDVEGTDGIKSVSYDVGGRIKSISITDDMTVMYNGEKCITLTPENLMPESGNLKFIDNTGDGRYDVLFITAYDTYVVKSPLTNDESFIDYVSGKTLSLYDFGDMELIAGGAEIWIEDFEKWDIVQIAADKSKTRSVAVKTREKVTGTVTRLSDESMTIGDTEYKLSNFYMNNSGKTGFTARANDSVNAYLDMDGNIAICDTLASASRNAAIIKAYDDLGETSETDAYMIKIIDREDGVLKLELADNVKIDGASYKDARLQAKMAEVMATTYFGVVPIIYDTNAEGKVSKLITPCGSELGILCNNEAKYYVHEANTFLRDKLYGEFCSASSTMFLYIPDNPQTDDDYVIKALQDLGDIDKTICAFSLDKSRIADIVLVRDAGSATVGETEKLAVVQKKYEIVDDTGEIVDALRVFKSGKETEILSKKAGTFADLKPGDIIFYSLNPNGQVENIAESYSSEELKVFSNPVNAKGRFLGMVYYKEGDVIGVSPDGAMDENNIIYSNLFMQPNIYIYNETRKETRIGTTDDIIDYLSSGDKANKVFIQTNYTEVIGVVLFEK